jgi:hypothetical protein
MAALHNVTIGFLRVTGASNNAEAIRRNASHVGDPFAILGITKK